MKLSSDLLLLMHTASTHLLLIDYTRICTDLGSRYYALQMIIQLKEIIRRKQQEKKKVLCS